MTKKHWFKKCAFAKFYTIFRVEIYNQFFSLLKTNIYISCHFLSPFFLILVLKKKNTHTQLYKVH